MSIVFHISPTPLEIGQYLETNKSRQDKKRIFASTHPAKSIIHASEGKDTSLQVCGEDSDQIFERFENALEKEFKNKKLYIYEIDNINDLPKERQFDSERVFGVDKEILNKKEIECALTQIKEYKHNNLIYVHHYPNRPEEYICACGKLDKDLLIKILLDLSRDKLSFSQIKLFLDNEFHFYNNDLDEVINNISKSKNNMEVINYLLSCFPEASKNDMLNLINSERCNQST